jgi:tRNA1(Val) A37 N6-methylase TrmN6
MLLVRGLNVLRGVRDLFLDAAQFLAGESVLDCTLGFGCEASLAALAVGNTGRVTGLESSPALAALTRHGMASFALATPQLREAMRRVNVLTADYESYLNAACPKSVDIIAFDPFFDARIEGSEHSLNPLARFGDNRPLSVAAVLRATIVAQRRVILKHPANQELPAQLQRLQRSMIRSRKAQTAYSIFDAASSDCVPLARPVSDS